MGGEQFWKCEQGGEQVSGLGVTRQSLVRVVLRCRKCNELIVYFFDFFSNLLGFLW